MPERERSRILVVTRNLPPLIGGMERLNWHLGEELAREMSVIMIGPAGAKALAPSSVEIVEVALSPLPRFLLSAATHTVRAALAWKPAVVFAGSGLTAPIAWLAARLCGASSVVYLHGLDIAVRHPLYRALWHPFLRRMDRVVANSRATAELAGNIGITLDRIRIVHPGVDAIQASEGTTSGITFRDEANLGNRPILLSAGRLSTRKGLKEFVTEVLPRVVEAVPTALLLVVGDAPNDALRAKAQTREQIQAAADHAGVGSNIVFLGQVTDRERLCAIYRSSTVHVFPVRQIEGDPEGFGMVAVEAAACGLQTVAYATGGIPDAVSDGVSGYLIPPGNVVEFADAVIRSIQKPLDASRMKKFAAGFDWRNFGLKLSTALPIASVGNSDDV